MAIINSSRNFTGSEMTSNLYGATIKAGVRTVNFRDQENKNGVCVFLLSAYKTDSAGNGVWYKVFQVRDNFGLEIKEKFPVLLQNDPIDYFASQAKLHFPTYAAINKTTKDNREVKVYPSFGRTTTKVLFNSAMFRSLPLGSHVLEIPQYGCADVVNAWVRGRTPEGEPNPMLNDYQKAIPVEFRLVQGAKGNPWQVMINAGKVYALPEQLADSAYLYNLDDVIAYPQIDELVEKLRKITPTHIFNKCMSGYSGGKVVIVGASVGDEDDLDYGAPQAAPAPTVDPSLNQPQYAPQPVQQGYNQLPQFAPQQQYAQPPQPPQQFAPPQQQYAQPQQQYAPPPQFAQTAQNLQQPPQQQAPQAPVAPPPQQAAPVAPAFNIPKAQISEPQPAQVAPPVPSISTTNVTNPMAGIDIDQARAFLKKPKQ